MSNIIKAFTAKKCGNIPHLQKAIKELKKEVNTAGKELNQVEKLPRLDPKF